MMVVKQYFLEVIVTAILNRVGRDVNMENILVVGSMNMDLVVNTEEIPKVGETVLGKSLSQIPGGKGANQGVAMAKLNGDVTFLGKVGEDSFGKSLLQSMDEANVNTSHIEKVSDSTGIAVINVDRSGNNNIVVIPGANWKVDTDYLMRNIESFKKADVVVFQLEIPLETVKEGLKLAKSFNKTTILNPAPAFDLDDETISYIDILIPNEHELARMAKTEVVDEKTMIKAAKILMDKGVNKIIVTLGEKGAFYIDSERQEHYDAFVVDVVDTTAAGDSFIAGFTTDYVKNDDIASAIKMGQMTAALSIQKFGAQSSLPTKAEVDKFKEGIL